MVTQILFHLILLCGLATVAASEVHYNNIIIIRPSQSQSCGDQYSSSAACVNNDLTLSQFIENSSNYLTNYTSLSFSYGNYSLNLKLIVENIHSFSMSASAASSSKAVIICGHNGRFEFKNVSIVTVSGLEFVGCLQNHVLSISQFQLDHSRFFGNSQAIVNGAVLSIDKSTANLDRVAFISAVDAPLDQLHQDNGTLAAEIILTKERMNGILLKSSNVRITQSRFEGNRIQFGSLIYVKFGSHVTVDHTTFVNNSASVLSDCNITGSIVYTIGNGNTVSMNSCKFVENVGVIFFGDDGSIPITHTRLANNECGGHFTNLANIHNNETWTVPNISNIRQTKISIMYSNFIGNTGFFTMYILGRIITDIDCSEFINNTGIWLLYTASASRVSVTRSEFIKNSATDSMLDLDTIMITVHLSKFVNNKAGYAVIEKLYFTTAAHENLTENVFIDNSAIYEVFVSSGCRPSLSLSLGSSRCIECPENWRRHLIGIGVAAFIAGIALVIIVLALNMTVAVGTLNGILFYAHTVRANADAYFWPFTAPNFVTIFISWLNLEIGFDICFIKLNSTQVLEIQIYKFLLQLAFPAYVILLVIIVIVASEYSSKFAKLIGKGNPVAVLATMILLSYTKLFNSVLALATLLYGRPAYGSRSVDVTRLHKDITVIEEFNSMELTTIGYFSFTLSLLTHVLCAIFTALVFSWQWLLRYQDKAIFKWVKYQKLHHFLEPYHAPYNAKYRYWIGLLLFIRVLLSVLSVLNFSLDRRVDLMSAILVIGSLILMKGVTAKRVYMNWSLDIMETAIYFNLVAFSALTWYNLDFGGNQVAVAYMSVVIIFILLMGVIIFHVLRYTWLYKCSFVEKAFKWTSSKLLEKNPDVHEELDGYQVERSAAGEQQQPTVTFSVIELTQPAQNYTD